MRDSSWVGIGSSRAACAIGSNLRAKLPQMFCARSRRIARSSIAPSYQARVGKTRSERRTARRLEAGLAHRYRSPRREQLGDSTVHGRHARAMARPVAQLLDPLLVGVVERDGLLDRVREIVARDLARLGERGVERSRDHLLELRAGQALGCE